MSTEHSMSTGHSLELSNLRPAEGSKHSNNFRRGRGHGSGNGKTAGKGHKGQKARSGAPRVGLYRRIPKRGFTPRNQKEIVIVNIGQLEQFEEGSLVDINTLLEAGIIKARKDGVKVLAKGKLTKKLDVRVDMFSKAAEEKIKALGGTAEEM